MQETARYRMVCSHEPLNTRQHVRGIKLALRSLGIKKYLAVLKLLLLS